MKSTNRNHKDDSLASRLRRLLQELGYSPAKAEQGLERWFSKFGKRLLDEGVMSQHDFEHAAAWVKSSKDGSGTIQRSIRNWLSGKSPRPWKVKVLSFWMSYTFQIRKTEAPAHLIEEYLLDGAADYRAAGLSDNAPSRIIHVIFAHKGGSTGGELRPERVTTLLAEPVQAILSRLAIAYKISARLVDYRLFDWELEPLIANCTIGDVPNPGVVFAVLGDSEEEIDQLANMSRMSSVDSKALMIFLMMKRGDRK